MNRTVYVNGEYLDEANAKISIFDRGFLFADAVYEVTSVVNGKLYDNEGHIKRLHRSCDELDIPMPATDEEIEAMQLALIEKNNLDEGMVYLQVSRGPADRNFLMQEDPMPSLIAFTQQVNIINSPLAESGTKVVTTPDIRWKRRDIKTVSLLGPSMAKTAAVKAGVNDAWFVEDGFVNEGSSNNAYILTKEGTIVTRHLGSEILAGITRQAVITLAAKEDLKVEERLFSVEEAYNAAEAFSSSATTFVYPVIEIDGKAIGDGKVGPIAKKLRQIYIQMLLENQK